MTRKRKINQFKSKNKQSRECYSPELQIHRETGAVNVSLPCYKDAPIKEQFTGGVVDQDQMTNAESDKIMNDIILKLATNLQTRRSGCQAKTLSASLLQSQEIVHVDTLIIDLDRQDMDPVCRLGNKTIPSVQMLPSPQLSPPKLSKQCQ